MRGRYKELEGQLPIVLIIKDGMLTKVVLVWVTSAQKSLEEERQTTALDDKSPA